MVTIRKRGSRWQVQIRRKGEGSASRSFLTKKDAEVWARSIETQADRKGLPPDRKELDRIILGSLILRYEQQVSLRKRGHGPEAIVLRAFRRHAISSRTLSSITPLDFAHLEAAHQCRNPLVLPVISLAVETGMRRGELPSLQWQTWTSLDGLW